MSNSTQTVKPLSFLKLGLAHEFVRDKSAHMEFVYGTGVSGLSTFERLLTDKAEGEIAALHIPLARAPEYFGHLFSHVPKGLLNFDPLKMEVRVLQVRTASSREVVQAMAKSAACGGECGCGCGGHG